MRESYALVRPFGRWKLALVALAAVVSGTLQMAGLASVFPFLALASNPEGSSSVWPLSALTERWPDLTHRHLILMSGAACILLIALANASALAYSVVQAHYITKTGKWLRDRVVRSYFERPMTYLHGVNSAVLVKKAAYDVYVFINFVLFSLLEVGSRTVLAAMIIILLASAAGWMVTALVGLGLTALYAIFYTAAGKRRAQAAEAIGQASRGLNVVAQQIVQGMRELRMRNCGESFLRKLSDMSQLQAKAMRTSSILGAAPRALIETVLFVALIGWVMFLAAGPGGLAKHIPVLGLIAVASLRLLPNFQMIYSYATTAAANVKAMDELLEELADADTGTKAKPQTPAPVDLLQREIRLENAMFSYPGAASPVINGVSLAIKRGTSVAFIGETGSGKSTLINIIAGLYPLSAGKLLVDGVELPHPPGDAWYRQIGYVPQDLFLFDGSLAENIALGVPLDEIDRAHMAEVCGMAQIRDFIEKELPQAYETEVGERGVRLSGGQRQRIALARALYNGPRILILDEATSALDNETEAQFMDVVYGLGNELTILMVAHRLSTVSRCHEIFVVAQGAVTMRAGPQRPSGESIRNA